MRPQLIRVLTLGVALFAVQACSSGKKLGERCELQEESPCDDDLVCTQGADFPQAVCSQSCSPAQEDGCPDEGECVELSTGAFCLNSCEADADCEDDFQCRSARVATPARKACVARSAELAAATPTCPAPRVTSGGVVGPAQPPTQCQVAVKPSSLPPGRAVPLGVHTVGERLSFDVPPGTYGLNLVIQTADAVQTIEYQGQLLPNYFIPLELRDPSGRVLYSATEEPNDLSRAPLSFYSFAEQTVTIGLPNTTASLEEVEARGGLPEGRWELDLFDLALDCVDEPADCVGGAATGTYDITLITQPAPPNPGAIDVAVYLASTAQEGFNATSAPANPAIQRMLASWQSFYAPAGVCLRNITFYDLPPWAQTRYSSVNIDEFGSCSELDQMFTLSQPGNTLNLFLVDTLASEENSDQVVAGIDGTIPGPSSVAGTTKSGAAVTIEDLFAGTCSGPFNLRRCGADAVAYIAAHEVGHWLGLYHTTESTGYQFDPLEATSSCRCLSCVSAERARECSPRSGPGTQVSFTDCDDSTVLCGGGENLMFWILDPASVGKLTEEQGKVMRSNPAVQAP